MIKLATTLVAVAMLYRVERICRREGVLRKKRSECELGLR
jgi:hypothetical protein